MHKGIVKQVLSGDCIVIRDRPRGGPPPERTIALSNIVAPRLGKRPAAANVGERFQSDSKDEPMAWESREYLRKLLVGKEVSFTSEHKVASGREYGYVYFVGKDSSTLESVAELVISEGLAELRRANNPAISASETYQKLLGLQESAKASGKGKWASDISSNVRQCVWSLDNPITFVEARHGKPLPAVIEHVRDGATYRLCILPSDSPKDNSYYHVTLMLSGVKTPTFKLDGDTQSAEPYAEEARYFVESRLLQREVQVKLETSSNQNVVGSILHPNGNIAELLLREGYAHCVDWSMGGVSGLGGSQALRAAEKLAKEKRLRIWKDWTPAPSSAASIVAGEASEDGSVGAGAGAANSALATGPISSGKTCLGKVVEVGNGDNITVKLQNGKVQRFFLSSVRAPRPVLPTTTPPTNQKSRPRPLYDIPYMFDAREFLRKKLIGKKVNIRIDYVQAKEDLPAGMQSEDRVCATVSVGEVNVAEALVSKGLANVVRYRATDENRSSAYDALLAAEAVAQKKAVGIHSKKETKPLRITDLAGDVAKAKNFLPFLKRGGRLEGIVEFVASGSRLRIYVPKETCLITLLLAGIECPRPPRRFPDGSEDMGDPMGQEALYFTKELVLQREVELEIDNMDKGGNYIGWLYMDTVGTTSNLSVALVENGFAKVHFTAEYTDNFTSLARAEDKAKESRLNIWTLESNKKELTEPIDTGAEEESVTTNGSSDVVENGKDAPERKTSYKQALVAVVQKNLRFFVQYADSSAQIQQISSELFSYYSENPALVGAYTPKKGDLCACKFVDDCWYRARVKDCSKPSAIQVFYVDFGNEEVTTMSRMASLPATLARHAGQAHEMRLALVAPPPDEDFKALLDTELGRLIYEKVVKINVEYDHPDGGKAVTVLIPETDDIDRDLGEVLLKQGLVVTENRKERRYRSVLQRYLQLQDQAMKTRKNIWQYGDFRDDE